MCVCVCVGGGGLGLGLGLGGGGEVQNKYSCMEKYTPSFPKKYSCTGLKKFIQGKC